MAKSAGTRGHYQRLMPITDKNIGKKWVKTTLHDHRYYKEGLARTEPVATVTRQQVRRKRITQAKHSRRFWHRTGKSEELGASAPRTIRPKRQPWSARP